MTTSDEAKRKPFWISIEEQLLALDPANLGAGNLEGTIQQVAAELDNSGINVSKHGGKMIELRAAVADMAKVGNPLLKDLKGAVSALTLEDVADASGATDKVLGSVIDTWPKLKIAARRSNVVAMVADARLDLLVAKAKELPGDEGIRYLLGMEVDHAVIVSRLEITEEKLKEVIDLIAAERAERKRVAKLLEKVEGKEDAERVRHLIENDVAEDLIIEMAGVDQGAIDSVKQAMEEEIKEKERLAAEEAERKRKEAEGPSLEDIPADQMIDYIDSIREIMEFSDQEKEIRVMCEQSSIPKALVDIAVSDPDKLDELEKQAEG